jgi:antitoxin component of MazEF toxin-antitoxin module
MTIKKLTKLGNSRALVIDKETLGHMGLSEGDKVQMTLHGQQLVITPVRPVIPDKDFRESLDRVIGKYGKLFRKLAE